MSYIEVVVKVNGEEQSEIVMAMLCDFPFESFSSEQTALRGYIKQDDLASCKADIDEVLTPWGGARYIFLEDENWNAVWESNYPSVEVGDKLKIRAPFHPSDPSFELEVVIMPKMSFGTGHHSTTYLVCQALTQMELSEKSVLDVGCGSGVLSIVALKKGAKNATGLDIDRWSYESSLENAAENGVAERMEVILGDISTISNCNYDIVVANINRNIITSQLEQYAAKLNSGGEMLLSGFFEDDAPSIIELARGYSLDLVGVTTREGWAMIHLSKL